MTVDSTLAFAARRNIPVRYNRELVSTTLKAMQRVSEIRTKRERIFYKNRMAGNKERQKQVDAKLVAENAHLLPKTRASENLAEETLAEDLMQEELEIPVEREKTKQKRRKRLLVSGGVVDEMDVD